MRWRNRSRRMSTLDDDDPEVFYLEELASRRVEPDVLRLRGGEVFNPSEVMVASFEWMHRVLDVIQAAEDWCEGES